MIKIQLNILIVFLLIYQLCLANNCIDRDISILNSNTYWKEVFVFNCFNITRINPLFPDLYTSNSNKYNEINLSPNFYTFIPKDQLCLFKNLISIDLSFNILKSADFRDFTCLTNLNSINLSNNQINSSILAENFENEFSSRLEIVNLTKNMIEYIESRTFIKNDGLSRFPRLKYLGLAYNKLKSLDLLWPLTIPSENLFIDLKYNNISVFANELKIRFDNPILKYPMKNNRKLDATTNSLQGFDDQNLLQYGLNNKSDLKEFLNKISNYDFRQANLVPTFICYCPSTGQSTLFWFSSLKNSVNRSKPIYQLYCINSPSTYVLDFPCDKENQNFGNSTNSYSTFQAIITNSISNIANQFASTTIQQSQYIVQNSTQINSDYFYLFFLIIPLILLFAILFLCGIGRFFNILIYELCKSKCCFMFGSKSKNRNYDAIICYNIFDEEFVLKLQSKLIDYKISLLDVTKIKSQKYYLKKLKNTLRIILIVSPEFFKNEFKSLSERKLLDSIKILCEENSDLVIMLLNKGTEKKKFNKMFKYLDYPYDYSSNNLCYLFLYKLKSLINYNCGLKQIEKINYNDIRFWSKFFYLMPSKIKQKIEKGNSNDQILPRLRSRQLWQPNETDSNLSYASDIKSSEKINHVIIPIPDFMKTSLGFNKSKRSNSQVKKVIEIDYENISEEENHDASKINQQYLTLKIPSISEGQSSNINNDSRINKNKSNSSDIHSSSKKERSESADILALFAPTQNSIFPMVISDKSKNIKDKFTS